MPTVTKYLLSEITNIDTNASNKNGFTALDVVEHSLIDSKALEIKNLLLQARFAKNNIFVNSKNPLPLSASASTSSSSPRGCLFCTKNCNKWWKKYINNVSNRLENARGNILVAASVTASMAFQAGINPPDFTHKSGSEQQQKIDTTITAAAAAPAPNSDSNSTLEIVLFPIISLDFWFFNTLSLMLSLTIMMLMLSGIPFRNMFSSFVLVIAMQAVVISTTRAYWLAAENNLFQQNEWAWDDIFLAVIGIIVIYLVPLMCVLIIVIHVCTFVMPFVFKIFKYVKKLTGTTTSQQGAALKYGDRTRID
ncbi:uncharacterized protein [Euphorbia lathyris]|uniref:uncharacterized protein n=1 Tax=Euphorbia lathyris TaxID=212925 RepID=UPI003313BB75